MSAVVQRESKSERLARQLVAARATLEAARIELAPKIEAAEAELARLVKAKDAADKAFRRASDAVQLARDACDQRLGFTAGGYRILTAAVKRFVEERGCPNASVKQLVDRYISRAYDADHEIGQAKAVREKANKESQKAYGDWNVATNMGGPWALRRQLDALEEIVRKLEREIAALPGRNEAARDRRAEEREASLRERDDEKARAIFDIEFKWEVQS